MQIRRLLWFTNPWVSAILWSLSAKKKLESPSKIVEQEQEVAFHAIMFQGCFALETEHTEPLVENMGKLYLFCK